jgi:threonylcarbamoyladenosine tRNA methylthiotransferase MtaB
MKAAVITLGCKVNDVESGSIIHGLEELGYQVTRNLEYADLYIINTCAVTAEAERKSRQTVGKALKCNPDARVIVCGCASEKSPTAFLGKDCQVKAVVGAKQKNRVLQIVQADFQDDFCGLQLQNDGGRYEDMLIPKCLRTRNFVKIQDGCNRFCSYCIIPYLRGRSRSRDMQSAVEEIKQSTALETVITGIDVSAYKDEHGNDLTALLLAVKDVDTRIRLGSMEVSLITDEFLAALQQVKNFAPHFHLSLQSGSDRVLKSMNRHYTAEEYLRACERIRAVFPDAGITTDIIAGFPTETEEDFQLSLQMVQKAAFSQIHAFPYSPREGTNAYKKYKELPLALKKERVEQLLAEGEKQKQAFINRFISKTLTIVPERCIDGYTEGYSENYIRVYVAGEMDNRPTQVRVERIFKDGVLGTKLP